MTSISGQPSSDDAFRLTMILAKLVGTLRIHLAQEDRSLYPELMASGRGGVAATARLFFEEMGQLAPQIIAYSEKWLNSSHLLADWAGFRLETDTVFAALADRIERENEILYPMADAMAEGRTADAA